mmetsp:Transcript_206/g.297  ORF Transcript_206/g.297 Transcript_206/m.297 type:complete len:317 (-) Transcript_206:9-959(-)
MKNQQSFLMIMTLVAHNTRGFLQPMRLLHSNKPNTLSNRTTKHYHRLQSELNIRSSCGDPLISNTPKTRQRLRPLVELTSKEARFVADIGCDHGLLSIALARKEKKRQVVGIDISLEALQQGAFQLPHQENLSFVAGRGLEPLLKNQPITVDTVCIAGMGVNTMMREILLKQDTILQQIECQQLVLQPTNNRPRNLLKMYQHLLRNNWHADREHMVYLSKRWYLTTSFVQSPSSSSPEVKTIDSVWPGDVLWHSSKTSSEQRLLYQRYAQHHVAWLKQEENQRSKQQNLFSNPLDLQWMQAIQKANVLKIDFDDEA